MRIYFISLFLVITAILAQLNGKTSPLARLSIFCFISSCSFPSLTTSHIFICLSFSSLNEYPNISSNVLLTYINPSVSHIWTPTAELSEIILKKDTSSFKVSINFSFPLFFSIENLFLFNFLLFFIYICIIQTFVC